MFIIISVVEHNIYICHIIICYDASAKIIEEYRVFQNVRSNSFIIQVFKIGKTARYESFLNYLSLFCVYFFFHLLGMIVLVI